MSTFKEFMNEAKESSNKTLPASNTSLSAIETSLTLAISSLLTPFSVPSNEKKEFSKKVSNLVRDEKFISQFSDCIDVPLEIETEDEFVERANSVLREMLYTRFGIKS